MKPKGYSTWINTFFQTVASNGIYNTYETGWWFQFNCLYLIAKKIGCFNLLIWLLHIWNNFGCFNYTWPRIVPIGASTSGCPVDPVFLLTNKPKALRPLLISILSTRGRWSCMEFKVKASGWTNQPNIPKGQNRWHRYHKVG